METFYSQHGEDFLLNEVFQNKRSGFFVEVGCLDGIEFSNTYFFEKKGWKGVCIEAHNDFIPKLRKNRPHASIVHCAIGETNKKDVIFYANKIGSLSTLDKNEEHRWKKNYRDYFYGFEEQVIPMRTLTSVFDELHVTEIDFISLDIEGYEVQALQGLNFEKYSPRVFIIEYKDDNHKAELEKILFPAGYKFFSRLGCNLFYGLVPGDARIITGRYGVIPLLQIDMEGVVHHHTADHLRPNVSRKIRLVLKKSIIGKIWRRYQQWRNDIRNRKVTPSYKEKRQIIESYRKQYGVSKLIETGTFLGDTVEYFKSRFEYVYSIELSEELHRDAVDRFKHDGNVRIIQGDSGLILKTLITEIDSPALFWLDGHYSSEFYIGEKFIRTAKSNKVTPIIQELETLLADRHEHVILIDDARLFTGEDDYPKIDEVISIVRQSTLPYEISVAKDIIRIVPAAGEPSIKQSF